jgi:Fe2+ or Zn2+ uptake regulation protein
MYLVNFIATTTRPLYEYEHQFAICESCFWCATTIFHKPTIKQGQEEFVNENSNNIIVQQQICPTCKNKSVSLTPLSKDPW